MEHEVNTAVVDGLHRKLDTSDIQRSAAVRQALLRDRVSTIGGLCGNCIHFSNCTYPKAVSDTWFCEEYEYERAEEMAPTPQGLVTISEQENEKLGLCLNCELRESCTFVKPVGGVWFCGEYR